MRLVLCFISVDLCVTHVSVYSIKYEDQTEKLSHFKAPGKNILNSQQTLWELEWKSGRFNILTLIMHHITHTRASSDF